MIDTHCHLDRCEGSEAELVARARTLGVTRIATVGIDQRSVQLAVAAAHAHEGVYAIVGRHPHGAEGFGLDDLPEIENSAGSQRVIAIGETGLDYYRDRSPREDQRRAFEMQIDLARRVGKPMVIHSREAEEDTFAILRERAEGITVVLHCFSAPSRVEECVERGYVCSFAGNVTYPKATELQAAARDLPAELLMVETDSPYLTPQPFRGQPNQPANVVATAEHVANLRGIEYAELEAAVESTAARVFGW